MSFRYKWLAIRFCLFKPAPRSCHPLFHLPPLKGENPTPRADRVMGSREGCRKMKRRDTAHEGRETRAPFGAASG